MKKTLILLLYLLPFLALITWAGPAQVSIAEWVWQGCMLLAGATWGVNQVLENHSALFLHTFPKASRRFWGEDSWLNKYKRRDVGNGRNWWPIWLTDGKHLTASLTQIFVFIGALFLGGAIFPAFDMVETKSCIVSTIIILAMSFTTYTAGNHLTYNIIFKNG